MARFLTIALAALLLAAGAAHAAPWSEPQRLSADWQSVSEPALASNGRGIGIALWRETTSLDGLHPVKRLGYSWRRGGLFGAPVTMGQGMFLGGITVDASGRALLLAGHRVGTRAERLEAYVGSPGQRLRLRQIVDRSRRPYFVEPRLAANARGDAVAVWENGVGRPRRVVYMAERSRGGRFSRGRIVSGKGAASFAVALGPSGQYVVVWLRKGLLEARLGRGPRLGRVMRVGRLDPVLVSLEITAAVDGSGDALVAWANQVGVRIAYRRAGRAFGRVRTVWAHASRDPLAAPVGRGRELLSWISTGVLAADVSRGAPSGVRRLSPPNDATKFMLNTDLAVAPDGRAAVAWTHQVGFSPGPIQLFASYRPAGGTFGPPEAVTPAGSDAIEPALAFDGRDLVALWSARSAPQSPLSPEHIESSSRR